MTINPGEVVVVASAAVLFVLAAVLTWTIFSPTRPDCECPRERRAVWLPVTIGKVIVPQRREVTDIHHTKECDAAWEAARRKRKEQP